MMKMMCNHFADTPSSVRVVRYGNIVDYTFIYNKKEIDV